MHEEIMMILWHWDPLIDQPSGTDRVFVKGRRDKCVIRINEDKDNQKTLEVITSEIQKVQNRLDYLILFIHGDSLSSSYHPQLMENLNSQNNNLKIKKITFGGGTDYLYYKPKSDTGLLNQFGNFANGNIYKNGVKGTVVTKTNIPGQFEIKPKYFQQVWDYYTINCKRFIYEFEKELFAHLYKYQNPQIQLEEHLQQTHSGLAKRYYDLTERVVNSNRLHQLYNGDKNILRNYEELRNFLYTQPIDNQFLPHARYKFKNLLDLMPEPIY